MVREMFMSLIMAFAWALADDEDMALLRRSARMFIFPGMWTYTSFTLRRASAIQQALATSNKTLSTPRPDVNTSTAAMLSQCTLMDLPPQSPTRKVWRAMVILTASRCAMLDTGSPSGATL